MPAALLIAAAVAAAPPDCRFDSAAMLALPFDRFDQDMSGGWRSIGAKGCFAAAADLLRHYRHDHTPLSEAERAILNWHEGQMRAFAGDYQRAIPALMRGVNDEEATAPAFREYALGTVAFLEHDREALVSARARLAAMPKPEGWSETHVVTMNGKPVTLSFAWPMNLSVLDALIKCFDRPYSEAYNCQ
jgi:hypothetical protein